MSRYIDAEWLIKEAMPLSFSIQKWVNEVQINDAPSIDIVRCDECKYNYGIAHNCEFNDEDIVCTYWESDGLTNIDFCSYGKERIGK